MVALMLRDGVISDELWDVLEPVMPQDAGRPGRPWNDHRTTLEGIVWRFRTGSPWRDLPDAFGAYQSVWQRHRLWSTDGTYERMFAAVREQAGLGSDELEPILSIDATIVRAHQHAAGARRGSVATDDAQDTGGTIELQEISDRARGAA
jgi:transposase